MCAHRVRNKHTFHPSLKCSLSAYLCTKYEQMSMGKTKKENGTQIGDEKQNVYVLRVRRCVLCENGESR